LALAARTAATLARSNAKLTSVAAAAVEHMAGRGADVVPELHVALAVWALDDLISDRAQAPWPAIRERLNRGNVYGIAATLRAYATCVAARQFDARKLVQALLADTPQSPAPSDGSVVLWLLEAAIDRCARVLSAEEPGLARSWSGGRESPSGWHWNSMRARFVSRSWVTSIPTSSTTMADRRFTSRRWRHFFSTWRWRQPTMRMDG